MAEKRKRASDYFDQQPKKLRYESPNQPSSHKSKSKSKSKAQNSLPPLPPITDPKLTKMVFTHASTLPANAPQEDSYESLEFLGDAYLEIIATKLIYPRFPRLLVGKKANLRERLVNNMTLSEFSKAYGLDKRINITRGSKEQTGWIKILGDVFEAYVAAVILSASEESKGEREVAVWLGKLWKPIIDAFDKDNKPPEVNVDYKTQLGALLLMRKEAKLEYLEDSPPKFDHGQQEVHIGVYLTGWGFTKRWLGDGRGTSKSKAGAAAAKYALENSREIIDQAVRKKAQLLENSSSTLGNLSSSES